MDIAPTEIGFVSLGNGIHLRHGSSVFKASPDSPNIVLIFGWMGAKLSHLSKYTMVYEKMYPHATQILVQSNPQFFWTSAPARMKNLIPVAEILEAHGTAESQTEIERPQILVHSFSNGGGLQMYTLGNVLRSRSALGISIPQPTTSALVIDSSPGGASLSGAIRAFTLAIPIPNILGRLGKILLQIPIVGFIVSLYGIAIIRHHIFGVQPIFERLKEALLSTAHGYGQPSERSILPWVNEKTPTMYVCSKMDELIPVEEIVKHFKEAKKQGLNVKLEIYEDTPHVAHARTYPKRYWGAVKDLWASAVANTEQ